MAQSFLAQKHRWQEATTGIKGLRSHQTQLLSFSVRRVPDMFSHSNFLCSNPEAQHVTVKTGDTNLPKGPAQLPRRRIAPLERWVGSWY